MRIVTADEAVSLLCDGDTLMISGVMTPTY
ncbi:Uncharacterised protein [Escherichia coli]|nr:Uncharacterised protein [Escherichia coli]CTW30666.1 Uncharacterised protein [Escherichia coli]CTZ87191.1 Uncharacterised protein [Escherichia coli]